MMITIREIRVEDPSIISVASSTPEWDEPVSKHEAYLRESQAGQRTVLVAEWAGEYAGYVKTAPTIPTKRPVRYFSGGKNMYESESFFLFLRCIM